MPPIPRFRPTKGRISKAWRNIVSPDANDKSVVLLDAITRCAEALEARNKADDEGDETLRGLALLTAHYVPKEHWDSLPWEAYRQVLAYYALMRFRKNNPEGYARWEAKLLTGGDDDPRWPNEIEAEGRGV